MQKLFLLVEVEKALGNLFENALDLRRSQVDPCFLVFGQLLKIMPRFLHLNVHFEVLLRQIK